MGIDFKNKKLDKNSSFEEIAQFAIETYYWEPFSNKPDQKPQEVNRIYHGGVHVSSMVNNIEIFLNLYKKYNGKLLNGPNGTPLTEEDIKLLKLGGLYHDVANTTENKGDPQKHAEIFKRDMIKLGFEESQINMIAEAIIHKDAGKDKKFHFENKNIYQKLLQSADCLDVIRIVNKMFNKEFLDIFHDLKNEEGFIQELDELINRHQKFYENFKSEKGITTDIHKKCEFAPNCFLAVQRFYTHLINTKDKPEAIIEKIITDQYIKMIDVIDLYNGMGVYVRVIDSFTNEMNIIHGNHKALEESKLIDKEAIKNYLLEQEREWTKIYMPFDFKWRPVTQIIKGIPIGIYGNKTGKQRAFIIISPTDPTTKGIFFYKKNIVSNAAKTGDFQYLCTVIGRAKDKKDHAMFTKKLLEMNEKREGTMEDPGLHYYGKSTLDCNEILLASYQTIIGIGVSGYEKDCAIEALKIYNEIKQPEMKFFRYLPETGLVLVSYDEILKQSNGIDVRPLMQIDESAEVALERKLFTNKNKISNIRKISLDDSLSTQNPLKFMFDFEGQPYSIYVKNKIPVVEFSLEDGTKVTAKTDLLPEITQIYFKQQIQEVQNLNPSSNSALNFLKKNNKYFVEIKIQIKTSNLEQYDLSDLLDSLKQMGWPPFKFGKHLPNELTFLTTDFSVLILLKDKNKFDKLVEQVKLYLEHSPLKMKPEQTVKKSGSKYPREKEESLKRAASKEITPSAKHLKIDFSPKSVDKSVSEFSSTPFTEEQKLFAEQMNQDYVNQLNTPKLEDDDSQALFFSNKAQDTETLVNQLSTPNPAVNHMSSLFSYNRSTDRNSLLDFQIQRIKERLQSAYKGGRANYYSVDSVKGKRHIFFIKNKNLLKDDASIGQMVVDDSNSIEQTLEKIKRMYDLDSLLPAPYVHLKKFSP